MLLFAIALIAHVARVVIAGPIEIDDGNHCRPNISVVDYFDPEAVGHCPFNSTWQYFTLANVTCNQTPICLTHAVQRNVVCRQQHQQRLAVAHLQ